MLQSQQVQKNCQANHSHHVDNTYVELHHYGR